MMANIWAKARWGSRVKIEPNIILLFGLFDSIGKCHQIYCYKITNFHINEKGGNKNACEVNKWKKF